MEYTEDKLMREKPKGEVILRTKDGKLFDAFVCHGCQSCLFMNQEATKVEAAYPHFLKLDEVPCKKHGNGDYLP
jgi:hypothetical protein